MPCLRCEAWRDSTKRALIRKGNLPVPARPCQDRLSRFPNQFHLPPASAGQQEFLRRQKIIPCSVQKTTPLPVKHLNRNCKKFELRKQIQNHGGFPPAASYCRKLFCWKFGHLIVERSEIQIKSTKPWWTWNCQERKYNVSVLRSHWLAGSMDTSKHDDDDDGKLILSLEKKLRSTI